MILHVRFVVDFLSKVSLLRGGSKAGRAELRKISLFLRVGYKSRLESLYARSAQCLSDVGRSIFSGGRLGEIVGNTHGRLDRGVRGLGVGRGAGVSERDASAVQGLTSGTRFEFLFFLETILVLVRRAAVLRE